MLEGTLKDRFVKARRQYIEGEYSFLNDMQRQAVMTTQGPLLILAGAGSGKTTVLINRIGNIIKYGQGSDSTEVPEDVTEDDLCFLEDFLNGKSSDKERAENLCKMDPADPWRIIAITFTNKAADELKERLSKNIGERAADVWAMTFHSACVRILRRDIDKIGYDRSFTIYDTSDCGALIKRIIKEFNLDDKMYNYRSIMSQISRAKDAMQDPEKYAARAAESGDVRKKNIGRIYLEYSSRLKKANAVDFDDLIMLTVKLLLSDSEVRDYYRRKFKYVLIDEYQDTNNLQYLLASTLAGGYNNICVVGDDDQSIYRFRGATVENILSFEKQYKNARTIRLEQNYRSTGHILAAANSVIKHNTGRKGKNLWTAGELGEKPVLYVAGDERDEAQYVAGKVIAGVAAGGSFGDFAVLYRMNAQSNQLEFAFKRSGIPYRVIGGTKFFDRAEIKDMLAYLSVISNPGDDLRLVRIVNQPARGIGNTTLERVQAIAAETGRPVFDVMENAGNFEELMRSAGKLAQFTNLIHSLREISQNEPLDVLYEEILDKTGYVRALEEKQTDENLTRIENIREFKTNIISYMRENPEGTLASFLDEISLYTDLEQLGGGECVAMMTMHSAKGLEFPTVFIVGAEEGIFPGSRTIGEAEEMEEERRLCYVAITRAKKELYFTCAKRRMLFGKTVSGKVSRFIEEIDPEHIKKPAPTAFAFGGESGIWDLSPESGGERSREYGYQNRTQGQGSYGSYAQRRKPKITREIPAAPASPSGKFTPAFSVGDRIKHRAFGIGIIKKIQPTGNDALMEVEFEGGNVKRLMHNSAVSFMERI